MTKQELVRLVEKLMNAEYNSEEERDEMIKLLESNVPHPEVSDLIFYTKTEMSPEEVVEIALTYQPIILPTQFSEDE